MLDLTANNQQPGRRSKKALRTHCVSSRMSQEELAILDAKRGTVPRGEWLRLSMLGTLPPVVPALNRASWLELGKALNNLNQLTKFLHINGVEHEMIDVIHNELHALRCALITVSVGEGV